MEELFRKTSEMLKVMGHKMSMEQVAQYCEGYHEDVLAMIEPSELAGQISDYMERDL